MTIAHDSRRIAIFRSFTLHHYIKVYLNVMLFNHVCSGTINSPLLTTHCSLGFYGIVFHYFCMCISVYIDSVSYIHPFPFIYIFLFLNSTSGISLFLLLLGLYSHNVILNDHWYNYSLWIEFQCFSRSLYPSRHPHMDALRSPSQFFLSTHRWWY